MKIRSKRFDTVETVTKEMWDKIVSNGFASEFEILDGAKMPDEVSATLKSKQDPNKVTKNDPLTGFKASFLQ